VVGSGLPQPIALLTLSYAGRNLKREDVTNDISSTLKIVNSKVEQHEQIKCVTILSGEWTVANGLLTPTLKIKRGAIENLYHAKYSEWYFKHPVNWE